MRSKTYGDELAIYRTKRKSINKNLCGAQSFQLLLISIRFLIAFCHPMQYIARQWFYCKQILLYIRFREEIYDDMEVDFNVLTAPFLEFSPVIGNQK